MSYSLTRMIDGLAPAREMMQTIRNRYTGSRIGAINEYRNGGELERNRRADAKMFYENILDAHMTSWRAEKDQGIIGGGDITDAAMLKYWANYRQLEALLPE